LKWNEFVLTASDGHVGWTDAARLFNGAAAHFGEKQYAEALTEYDRIIADPFAGLRHVCAALDNVLDSANESAMMRSYSSAPPHIGSPQNGQLHR